MLTSKPPIRPDDTTLYFDMLEQAADGVVIINQFNHVVFFNTAAEQLWGCSSADVIGKNVNCLVPLEQRPQHDGYINHNRNTGVNRIVGTSREVVFTRTNGDYVAAEMSISTAIIGPDKQRYYMAFLKGVTEESHRRKILDLQNRVFHELSGEASEQDIADMLCAEAEQLVPNSVAALLQVNSEQTLEILSGEGLSRRKIAMLMRITLNETDVVAMSLAPEEARSIVWNTESGNGYESEFLDCWASAITNGAGELIGIFVLYSRNRDKITNWPQKIVRGCVPSCAAIIERGKTRQQLSRLDRYDALTGLLNRNAVTTILRDMTLQPTSNPFALLVLDVDLFQDINNLMGYDKGDALLQTMAQRLTAQCRSNFITGRLGGDDFVVIIPNGDHEIASAFADSLTAAMREPVVINNQELIISLSIGISLYPDDGLEIENILNRAEMAMLEAKKTARKSFRLMGSIVNDDVRARVIIGSALRKALQDSELELFYQPQISIKNNMLYGVEALSRWHHPTLGTIPPSRFIPIAEETAQIEAIGLWSLEKACAQIVEWDKIGLYVPIVSVNLSAAHFSNPTLTEQIVNLLTRYNLSPKRLTIEITEGGMMQQNVETMTTLTALREIGVGLSLDDFGTGFSSLSRISHLPLTEIKIDRSFIINFEKDVSSLIVTEAAINIGKRLGVHVVTEGVEDTFQETRLRSMGCDVMQGYLFARPMPPTDLLQWVQTRPSFAS